MVQWIGQRQLQDENRSFGFDVPYTRGFTVSKESNLLTISVSLVHALSGTVNFVAEA